MVHGLVKQSGGFIHLDSEVGQGTTSASICRGGAEAEAAAKPCERGVPLRQQPTILVVEDEGAVRRMAWHAGEFGLPAVSGDRATAWVLEATPRWRCCSRMWSCRASSGVDLRGTPSSGDPT